MVYLHSEGIFHFIIDWPNDRALAGKPSMDLVYASCRKCPVYSSTNDIQFGPIPIQRDENAL